MEHLDAELARGLVTGSAPPEVRAHWEEHVRACPRCRALLARERQWAGLARLDREPPELAGGAERLLARMHLPADRRRYSRRVLAVVLAALAGGAGGLAYRLATAPAQVAGPAMGPDLRPPRELLARLELVQVLQRDPWLLEDFETVRWMAERLSADPGAAP